MDTNQTNQVNMQKAVEAYLDEHESVWSPMAPFGAEFISFKATLAAIDDAAQQQETPSGATQDKASARDALEDAVFLMCEALGVLAHQADDKDLIALTDIAPSTLGKLDAEALSNRATIVLAAANGKKTELATLQVTQANIDELGQALQNFNTAKVSPRTTTAERRVKTASLPRLIRDANGILKNRLDRMVNLFQRSNPEFVAGYKAAREIVNRAASHATKPTTTSPPPAQPTV